MRAPRTRGALAADLLAVDVGNSKLLAALFRAGRERLRVRIDYNSAPPARWAASWARALRALREVGGGPVPVLVASVAPRRAAIIERQLRAAGYARIRQAGWRDPWPFAIRVRNPATLGVDRLANVAGLVALGFRSGVAIDAGTAITVDVLDRRRLRGGLILPGFALAARALHAQTEQLPQVRPLRAPALVGRDTRAALQSGIHHGLVGAVGAVAVAARRQLEPGAVIVFTGGDGERFWAECRLPGARFEPDLLLLGLRRLGRRIFAGRAAG